MKRRLIAAAALLLGVPLLSLAQGQARHSYVPPNGFVPDSITAVRIAFAVWTPIYGQRTIQAEAPYHAHLEGAVWTVYGSMPSGDNVGGVAVVEIAKQDARILRVSHGM